MVSCKISASVSLIIMLPLTVLFFLAELICGHMFRSLVLQADAFHMLSDIISLIVGIVAEKISKKSRKNKNGVITNTFGYERSTIIGSLINSVFLIAICVNLFAESIKKFISPEKPDQPFILLGVGIGGLVVNILGILLFHNHAHGHDHDHSHPAKLLSPSATPDHSPGNGSLKRNKRNFIGRKKRETQDIELHEYVETASYDEIAPGYADQNNNNLNKNDIGESHKHSDLENTALREKNDSTVIIMKKENSGKQLNMKGVYFHVLGDLLGSLIVVLNTVLVITVKKSWVVYIDPIFTIISVFILLFGAVPLCTKAVLILMQMVPHGFSIKMIKESLIEKFPSIQGIHDFHVWQLAGSKIIASVHILFADEQGYYKCVPRIKSYFHFIGIHSVTVQPEFLTEPLIECNTEDICLLKCPEDNCMDKQCC